MAAAAKKDEELAAIAKHAAKQSDVAAAKAELAETAAEVTSTSGAAVSTLLIPPSAVSEEEPAKHAGSETTATSPSSAPSMNSPDAEEEYNSFNFWRAPMPVPVPASGVSSKEEQPLGEGEVYRL